MSAGTHQRAEPGRDLEKASLSELADQVRATLDEARDELGGMIRTTQANIDALTLLVERAPSLAKPQSGEDEGTDLEAEIDQLEARLEALRDAFAAVFGGIE